MLLFLLPGAAGFASGFLLPRVSLPLGMLVPVATFAVLGFVDDVLDPPLWGGPVLGFILGAIIGLVGVPFAILGRYSRARVSR